MAILGKISVSTFCDVHGLDNYDRFVAVKKFQILGNKTYDEWHETLKNDIDLGDKKNFPKEEVKVTPPPAEQKEPSSTETKK